MNQNLAERLDPELKGPVMAMINQGQQPIFDDLPAARAASKKMLEDMKLNTPEVPGVKMEDKIIPGPEGSPDFTIRVYRPEKQTGMLPALVWIHGGGYMMGELDQEDFSCSKFVLAGDCLVVSVEYRLAPENPYPAPLEDCYAALKWVAGCTDELGVDSSRIAVGGASAGGGLAAGLALLARDRREVDIMFQLLVYPMIDDCNIVPASDVMPDAILWTRTSNLTGWRSYLGFEPGGEGVSCYASASRANDLRNLPSAYVTVGDLDLFAQENVDYARRLIEAGVSTELHVYPGGCHAFDMILPEAEISQRFIADIQRALKRALHS